MKFYGYKKCGTCRKAEQFLKQRGVAFTEIPIREQPPAAAELRLAAGFYEGNWRKLFNTSGQDYKAMRLSVRLPEMSEAEILKLLAGNGNLVKRPFVVHDGRAWAGFNADGSV